jgi:metal-responsive CopG/Arc/MetJ family transcriptional regulator
MEPDKTARVQFDFKPQALDVLDRLVQRTDATSRAEVVRKALALYKMTLQAQDQGKEVYFIKGDERERLLLT